eukprot:COSAG04_NODE_2441_length_4118_cov_3.509579_1_plen_413_part_00
MLVAGSALLRPSARPLRRLGPAPAAAPELLQQRSDCATECAGIAPLSCVTYASSRALTAARMPTTTVVSAPVRSTLPSRSFLGPDSGPMFTGSESPRKGDSAAADENARGLRFGPSAVIQPGGAPGPIEQVLGGHPALAGYAPLFAEAEIDTELALEMSAADLRSLLPSSAPFGHSLRIRQVLQEAAKAAAQPRALIPKSLPWRLRSQAEARGILEDDARNAFVMTMEFNLITASLFFSTAMPAMLEPPSECGDGSACPALRSVDACLWAAASVCFLVSVGQAWVLFLASLAVSTKHFARWAGATAKRAASPANLVVQGFVFLGCAMATRILVLDVGGNSFPAAVKWSIAGCVVFFGVIVMYCFWFSLAKTTFSVSTCELPAFQLGTLGWWLPKKHLGKELREETGSEFFSS